MQRYLVLKVPVTVHKDEQSGKIREVNCEMDGIRPDLTLGELMDSLAERNASIELQDENGKPILALPDSAASPPPTAIFVGVCRPQKTGAKH